MNNTPEILKGMGGIIPKNAVSQMGDGVMSDCFVVDGRKLTPEQRKSLQDFNSGKMAHRAKVVNPGASAFQRVKAKVQPVDAKKSICTPNYVTGIDLASGPDHTVMHKISGPANSPVGTYADIADASGDVAAWGKEIRRHTFHDTRRCHTYGVYFIEAYGTMMPVVINKNFYPAPKPIRRDKGNKHWNRIED